MPKKSVQKVQLPDKLKFKYIFSDDYNPKYVNGAYGGITTKGELAVNFYFERSALPNSQTYKLNKKGGLADQPLESDPKDLQMSMVRVIQGGIILDVRSGRDIVKWLTEKLDTLEKLKSGKSSNKK